MLGQAPLDVTLTATGDAVSYHWDLGDGSQADGAVVQHRYEAGRFTATVTGTALDGSQAQASVTIIAARLTLTGPKVGTYGQRAMFKGRVIPALRGAPVSLFAGETEVRSGKADKKGRFSFRMRLRAIRHLHGPLRLGRVQPGRGAATSCPRRRPAELAHCRASRSSFVLRSGRAEAGASRSASGGAAASCASARSAIGRLSV